MPLFASPRSAVLRLGHLIVLTLVVGLVWVLLESLLFRTGFYYRHLAEPHSNAGTTALKLRLARRDATSHPPTILVFGDSRVGEGFSPVIAQQATDSVNFVNVAAPGSSPRTWYYLLRAMVRKNVPFKLVVVGLVYPPTGASRLADWPLDPAFMAPLVDLRDAIEFPASFVGPHVRARAREAIWLPTVLMQKDIQNLLASPRERRRHLHGKLGWLKHIRNYRGRDETMPPLAFDPDHRVIDWKNASQLQRTELEQHLRTLKQVPFDNSAFAQLWFGQLLELIRENDAQLVFYPLPRGPYQEILPLDYAPPDWLSELANERDVTVLPADFLIDLEAPQYFFDALHANRAGRAITSERVAKAAAAILAERAPVTEQAGPSLP